MYQTVESKEKLMESFESEPRIDKIFDSIMRLKFNKVGKDLKNQALRSLVIQIHKTFWKAKYGIDFSSSTNDYHNMSLQVSYKCFGAWPSVSKNVF